jgi:DNA-binding HxlR family transcriptional regulator
MAKARRSDCPISSALDIFGDRWSLLVIRDLLFKGKVRYGEFLDSEEGVSTNVLADRLQTLEAHGLIEKRVDPSNRSALIYSLTPKGRDLAPMLVEMILWSAEHDPMTAAPEDFIAEAREDREALLDRLRSPADDRLA